MYRKSQIRAFSCAEVKKRIPDFMKYKLEANEAQSVVKHCEKCRECMEELKLIFLVESCIRDIDEDDIESLAEEELIRRFEEIAYRLNFFAMIKRNSAYFAIGASVLLALSVLLNILV